MKINNFFLLSFLFLPSSKMFAPAAKVVALQSAGVLFEDPENVYVDPDVNIGVGTVIGTAVKLTDGATIGTNCTINSFGVVSASTLLNNVSISFGTMVLLGSTIGENSTIGGLCLVQNSTIGANSSVSHRSTCCNSQVGTMCTILPFCDIENSILADGVMIKNFNHIKGCDIHIGPIEPFQILENLIIDTNNTVIPKD